MPCLYADAASVDQASALADLATRPILTVSDTREFVHNGGMIGAVHRQQPAALHDQHRQCAESRTAHQLESAAARRERRAGGPPVKAPPRLARMAADSRQAHAARQLHERPRTGARRRGATIADYRAGAQALVQRLHTQAEITALNSAAAVSFNDDQAAQTNARGIERGRRDHGGRNSSAGWLAARPLQPQWQNAAGARACRRRDRADSSPAPTIVLDGPIGSVELWATRDEVRAAMLKRSVDFDRRPLRRARDGAARRAAHAALHFRADPSRWPRPRPTSRANATTACACRPTATTRSGS